MERELVFTDEKFVEQTKAELQKALAAQQHLLNVWNGLKIGACPDLFRLIHTVTTVYSEVVAPGSKQPQLMPDELYRAAYNARKCLQAGRKELWSISEDGTTVLLNQANADALLRSRDVWIETEEQREFVRHVVAYQESGSYLYKKLQGMLNMKVPFIVPYSMTGRAMGMINDLVIEMEALKEMVQRVERNDYTGGTKCL
ncbi:MAG TPA: hypothetical protein DCX95_01145 [Elusimicrobia bacterium]|nr:hypothetical protein [Elusimicrobiota bacterium]